MAACQPIEMNARDTAATLGGLLTYGQGKYGDQCKADKTQAVCKSINQGIDAQNLLISATETYCGWSVLPPPDDKTATCVPVKSAETALKTAISNAGQITTELKGALGK